MSGTTRPVMFIFSIPPPVLVSSPREQDRSSERSGPYEESVSILEYLERENLFLISLDDQRIWFRYHHLFADLLRARLRQSKRHLVPVLHIRAAAWFEQNGLIPEALNTAWLRIRRDLRDTAEILFGMTLGR